MRFFTKVHINVCMSRSTITNFLSHSTSIISLKTGIAFIRVNQTLNSLFSALFCGEYKFEVWFYYPILKYSVRLILRLLNISVSVHFVVCKLMARKSVFACQELIKLFLFILWTRFYFSLMHKTEHLVRNIMKSKNGKTICIKWIVLTER